MNAGCIPPLPHRIVSGGQTGVDRGGLEAAMARGIAHGGWCPKGRLAEDGSIPSRYLLEETDSSDYTDRTRQNVIDSDATLILYEEKLTGGTLLTAKLARRMGKPHTTIRLDVPWSPHETLAWLAKIQPSTLNIAGPRESSRPGIQTKSCAALLELFALCKEST